MLPEKEEIFTEVRKFLKYDIRYNADYLPRPFIVELCGTPCSGKTTIAEQIYNSFRRSGLQRIYIPQEAAEIVQHIERTTPLYNLRTFTESFVQLVDISHGHAYDLVIFSRCAFDAYCWMSYWFEKGQLSQEETTLYQSFVLSKFWVNKIDAAFFITCDAEEAMRRELRITQDRTKSFVTNPETIKVLVERYNKSYQVLKPDYPQLHLLDTTSLSESEMVGQVSDIILRIFWEKSRKI